MSILTKTSEAHRTDWELKLSATLWAYCTSYKVKIINCTPFKMVYGQEAVMPWEFVIPSLRVAAKEGQDGDSLAKRLVFFERLGEERQLVVQNALVEKVQQKKWSKNNWKHKDIKFRDKAIMYGEHNEKKKLKYVG